jgi:hypothetical protein
MASLNKLTAQNHLNRTPQAIALIISTVFVPPSQLARTGRNSETYLDVTDNESRDMVRLLGMKKPIAILVHRLVITGHPGTSRIPVAIFPLITAKLTFQSFQRTSFSSPPCPK